MPDRGATAITILDHTGNLEYDYVFSRYLD
jgi:hypothetical protein